MPKLIDDLYMKDSSDVARQIADTDGSLYQAGTKITATAAELNTLDGITATTAELNVLDGITATTAELNQLSGVAGAVLAAVSAGKKVAYGVTSVTGSIDMATGLAAVESVIACLGQDPNTAAGGACTATGDLSATAGNILLKCWDSAFAAATLAADVNWVAIGT